MKRILILAATLALALSAVSCGCAKEEREPGKYTYAELEEISAEELTRVLTENGMVIPDALTKGKTDEEIASMVKEFFPNIVSGVAVMDWTVPVNFAKDAHVIYEKIILRSSPVSGKYYVSEADGFGSKQSLTFNDDGSGQYYVGMLSSYIAFGEWTANGDTVTLTVSPTEWDGEDAKGFALNFRIGGDKLIYIPNGSEAMFSEYLHDGDVFTEGDRTVFYPNGDKADNADLPAKKIEPGDTVADFIGKDGVRIIFNYLNVYTLEYDSHFRVVLTDDSGTVENVIVFDSEGNIVENTGAAVCPPDLADFINAGNEFDSVLEIYGQPTVISGASVFPGYITTDGKLYVLNTLLSSHIEIIEYDLLAGDPDTDSVYRYTGEGIGGDFTITLSESGRFQYYEGMLSSYIGMGHWTVEDGILTLKDDVGLGKIIDNEDGTASFENTEGFVNRFKMEDGKLVFIAEGSDNFLYVKLDDGAIFERVFSSPVLP